MRQVLVYQDEDEYWAAEMPSLPGCLSQGKTEAEALENIKDAINLYIEVLTEQGKPIPEDYPRIHVAEVA